MILNLLDLANQYLSDDVVSQVSNYLGETEPDTRTALDGALPTVLSGLVQRAAEPGGTSSVMDLMAQLTTPNRVAGEVITPDGGIVSRLGNLFEAGNLDSVSSLLATGSGVLASLFGNEVEPIAGSLATYSGVKPESASALLSLAGPVLLGILGQKMADDEGGPNELASLMSSQAGPVQSAMPAGLRSLLGGISGLGLLGGVGTQFTDRASAVDDPAPHITAPISDGPTPSQPFNAPTAPVTPTTSTTQYRDQDNRSTGSGIRWLPWVLLLLGIAALLYFVRGCGNDARKADDAAAVTADSLRTNGDNVVSDANLPDGSAVGAAVDSAGDAIDDATARLGAFFKRKLPSGYELNIPEKGIENNLVRFIEDKDKAVDKDTWFNFGRLLFDTGKATLKPNSKDEVSNIAEILKAYPAVNIKIGGYTDNTGDAKVNQKLSEERATAVMNELVALGIDKSRLEAEGYGSEHPVASNDTEAGRAQNRRIAVRVTKK